MEALIAKISATLYEDRKRPRYLLLLAQADPAHSRVLLQGFPCGTGAARFERVYELNDTMLVTQCGFNPQVLGHALRILLGHANFVLAEIRPDHLAVGGVGAAE